MNFENDEFSLTYGPAKVERFRHDDKEGWSMLFLETPKYNDNKRIQIYVTKTGKVRIFDHSGEWQQPTKG